jgi:hypothetical protein
LVQAVVVLQEVRLVTPRSQEVLAVVAVVVLQEMAALEYLVKEIQE